MNIVLFDNPATKTNLLPFTYTRPVSDVRIGILTIREKWEKLLPADYSYLTEEYLQDKYAQHSADTSLYLNGCVLPDDDVVAALLSLKENQLLLQGNTLIAFYGKIESVQELVAVQASDKMDQIQLKRKVRSIDWVFDIFVENREEVFRDFDLITAGRQSAVIEDRHTIVYGNKLFVEESAKIRSAILNTENGPIYIGENAEIGEGSIVRGATSIGENSSLNLGTRIRGDSCIGPYCKVGGEISNSVIFGYSSKSHDGYLGNSVVGEWCNMGADTNTSNLKNNYKNVKIWNYTEDQYVDTNRQFCGLMMGDHSKCGINTMFNTGTVVGVSANIFGAGFPRTFIPSFAWGAVENLFTYQFDKALEVMPLVMERRNKSLAEADFKILKHIFDATKKYRNI